MSLARPSDRVPGQPPVVGAGSATPTAPAPANELYCVLVSSCDAYADCWPPFFTLLARYWQPMERAIYLNTETVAWQFPGLDIRCPRVGLSATRRMSWSERLHQCLDAIPHEIVLYVQEDYFLHAPVDVSMLDRMAALMRADGISHISLERDGRPGRPSQYRFLNAIDQKAEYRISAQAGLWNVSALKSYLRSHETVWEFEWYGTRRARRRHDSLFFVNEEYEQEYGRKLLFPYVGTGIVQGRWVRHIVEDLFTSHGLDVDFSARGFLEDGQLNLSRRPRLVRAVRRLRSLV